MAIMKRRPIDMRRMRPKQRSPIAIPPIPLNIVSVPIWVVESFKRLAGRRSAWVPKPGAMVIRIVAMIANQYGLALRSARSWLFTMSSPDSLGPSYLRVGAAEDKGGVAECAACADYPSKRDPLGGQES